MNDQRTIYQAIGDIIGELGGIGKGGFNKDQGYKFRGIDDVLKEVHPLLGKHGVFFAPTVLERIYEERISKQGSVGHVAHLHVQYTVYGPSGDSVQISTWGEGLDYSDKSTNKAMTAAFKYALFELFAIADPTEDGDTETHEGGETGKRQVQGPTFQKTHSPYPANTQTANVASDDPRIDLILRAAQEGDNEFLSSLASQFIQKGTLTEKQIESGTKTAQKIVTTPRSAPPREDYPFADEEERF